MTASDLPLTNDTAPIARPSDDDAPARSGRRGLLGQLRERRDAEAARMQEAGFTVERSGLLGLTHTYRASDQLREQIAREAALEHLEETAAHLAQMHANVRALHFAATGHDVGETASAEEIAERLAALRPQA